MAQDWAEPPHVEDPFDHLGEAPFDGVETRFDIDLFEQLNKEYEAKPLVPKPLQYDADSIFQRSRKRLLELHNLMDLSGKRVLEIGCGAGYEVWLLANHFDSEAWGIDVSERRAWASLSTDRTRYVEGDIALAPELASEYFDRIISTTVWEHIANPFSALQETYRVLKPGGLAWIRGNLYRSALASHMYREITFPFPHLLFSDEVFREFYRRRGEPERPSAWVNRLTWSQYERYFELIGFDVRMANFEERPLDEEFYRRFESALGRYPRFDLTKDFFTVILQRPRT
jgi:ubiquinone/menaquinone biosynthesis C-methylase UbiE